MMKSIATYAILSILLLLGLSTAPGCGDGLKEVLEGDARCVGTCAGTFNVTDPTRPSVGASGVKVTIENIGGADLRIFSIELDNTSPRIRFENSYVQRMGSITDFNWRVRSTGHSFEILNNHALVLRPGERHEIELEMEPVSQGVGCPSGDNASCGAIVIRSNARGDGSTIRAPIGVSVGDGAIAVEPTTINFPDPVIGQTFEETFNVINVGRSNLIVNSIELDRPDATITIASSSNLTLPITIQQSDRHEFTVRWTPNSSDELNMPVYISNNDAARQLVTITLRSGAGDVPVLDIDPCTIEFQEAIVGTPNTVEIDVSNTGAGLMNFSLNLRSFSPVDAREEFRILNNSDESVQGQQPGLQAGQTRTYRLVYTPTEERAVSGELTVNGNFGTSRTCRFTAGPAAPQIEVVPPQLYWGGVAMGETQVRSFVVYNRGRATLEVSQVTLTETGDTFTEFFLEDGVEGGFDVLPGGSRRVDITYTRSETDVDAPDRGTVLIEHNDPVVATQRVNLEANHGDALLPPTCVITPSAAEPYSVGQTLTFDARESTPADGTDFVANPFLWNVTTPTGSTAALSANVGDTVSLTFDREGTYTIALTATSQIGGSQVSCEQRRNLQVQ